MLLDDYIKNIICFASGVAVMLFIILLINWITPLAQNTPTIITEVNTLVSETNKFYKYNITDDNITLTDQDLYIRGGDCKDWSEYYERHLSNYTVRTEAIFTNNKAHMYTVVADDEAYCIINMQVYTCWRYK